MQRVYGSHIHADLPSSDTQQRLIQEQGCEGIKPDEGTTEHHWPLQRIEFHFTMTVERSILGADVDIPAMHFTSKCKFMWKAV